MHKYMHHIGDFMRDTAHLSPLEECYYRRAMDFCYLNESPLPKETQSVFRRLRAKTQEEQDAVLNVLADFFTEEDDGYHNKRCDTEIAEYQGNAEKNRENGKKGGRPPKNKPTENPKETQSVILGYENETQTKGNQQPTTKNQEPLQSIGENSIFTQPNEPVPAVTEKQNAKRGTRLPDDWEPSEKDLEWIKTNKPSLPAQQIADQTLAFKNYWTSKTGKDATKLDWSKTYQNWFLNLRTAGKYQPNQQPVTSRNVNDHWDSIPMSNQPLTEPPVEIPEGFV